MADFDLLRQLDHIQRLPDGGYQLPDTVRAGFAGYLARYGFDLATLKTCDELLEALGHCNSADFEMLMQKPAPAPHLRFIWNRMRNLGRGQTKT